MVKIPLRYSDRVFGHAMIDDEAEHLSRLGYYSVTLPRQLRRYAGNRPDIILATLKEDPLTRQACTPFVSLFGTQILLVHLVIRPALAKIVLDADMFAASHPSLSRGSLPEIRSELNDVRSTIGRVAYANGDRTDCRAENIREL
jgi:hypothetical protein